jgi:hypothetical protein
MGMSNSIFAWLYGQFVGMCFERVNFAKRKKDKKKAHH